MESHAWPVPTSASRQPRSRLDWVTWVKEWEDPCQPALEKGVLPRASPKLRHRAPCKAEEGAPWADAVLPTGGTWVAVIAAQPWPFAVNN